MADLTHVDEIVTSYQNTTTPLIYILKDLQKQFGFLSKEVLTHVAKLTRISLSEIFGVATFYSLFTIKPKGKYIVRCCNNAPCHVKNASEVLNKIKEYLGIEMSETTPDHLFTLEFTSCLGLCAVAPVMMINEEVYGNLTPEKATAILKEYKMKGISNA